MALSSCCSGCGEVWEPRPARSTGPSALASPEKTPLRGTWGRGMRNPPTKPAGLELSEETDESTEGLAETAGTLEARAPSWSCPGRWPVSSESAGGAPPGQQQYQWHLSHLSLHLRVPICLARPYPYATPGTLRRCICEAPWAAF